MVVQPETVRLDVSGRVFRVSKSLLTSQSDSMLARMVSDTWKPTSNDEALFIDRDADRFCRVLEYLRDPEMFIYPDATLRRELDFFCIPVASPPSLTMDIQPGLRTRAIKAGECVFQAFGDACFGSTEDIIDANKTLTCYVVFDAKDPSAIASASELSAVITMLSVEQLSELWIPEYGLRCRSFCKKTGWNPCSIELEMSAVPFVTNG